MPSAAPGNLPTPVSSLVGRGRERAEAARLLDDTRLLTLTGAGGAGKTRLALAAAADVAGRFPDGVWLVELAPLADPALVPQAVAAALGMRGVPGAATADVLVAAIAGRRMLVVLDNCEHLVDAAAALVAVLLPRCPGLVVLATGREPLGCPGETVYRVPPLAVPPAGGDEDPAEVAGYDAVRLFLERARAVRPGVEATEHNCRALAEICRRLDGMPLGIELAAARVAVFSAEQIAARLDERFWLLTGGPRAGVPRHRTLRAATDWSHDLLADPERRLLRRLSVFRGGWTLEAATAVVPDPGERPGAVVDLLASLVDKSLVGADEQAGAVRYRMPETIREYAAERLRDAGETDRLRDRHLAHFLEMAERAEPEMRGPRERAALDRLEADHDNLRAALERARDRDPEAALRLAGALGWLWWARNHFTEGIGWLERTLAASSAPSPARTRALLGYGWLQHHQFRLDEAAAALREALAAAGEAGDRSGVAWALHLLGRVACFAGDLEGAAGLARRSLAEAEAVGDALLVAWALHLAGLVAQVAGDLPSARRDYGRALEIRRREGYREGTGILLSLVGLVAHREGDDARALEHFGEALGLTSAGDLGGEWGAAPLLGGVVAVAAATGRHETAARLAGAATALSERYAAPLVPVLGAAMDEGVARARVALGPERFAQAFREGAGMGRDPAIAEARAVRAGPAPPSAAAGPLAALTPAERRVLGLVAAGRTTREVAETLVVAVSTVERHLTHIYGKLGVRNRTEAAAVALRHGLGPPGGGGEGDPHPGSGG